MFNDDPVSVAWRIEQARVDADIEGLAFDPATEMLMDEMRRERITPSQMRERLREHFTR